MNQAPSIGEAIRQTQFHGAGQKLVINLIYTAHYLERRHQILLRRLQLTPEQYNLLRILRGRHPAAWGIADLTERMLNKESNASRLVDKLLAKGLVDRKTCESDRRAVEVRITEEGLALLTEIDPIFRKDEQKLASLSAASLEEASDLLDRVRALLGPCEASSLDGGKIHDR